MGAVVMSSPGLMELAVMSAGFLCSVVLPIAAVVGIFLYLQKIDKRLERMEEWMARQRAEHDPSRQDPGSPSP